MTKPRFLVLFQLVAPGVFNSRAFSALRDFVKDPRFDRYVMTSVLLANLVTVAIETTLDMENLPSQAIWQVGKSSVIYGFSVSMLMRQRL